MKTAIVIGATGLIGKQLVKKLIDDKDYSFIKVFVRASTGFIHPKVEEVKINFDRIDDIKHLITGDVLFSSLGTTIKSAGGKKSFEKIDLTYNLNFAEAASQNGVKQYVLVSSLGANAASSNFYLQTKGKLEKAVSNLNFQSMHVLQPSMLLGNRSEFRLGELIGKKAMKLLSFVFLGPAKKYKAIESAVVAQAMLILSKQNVKGVHVLESDQIEALVANNK